MRPGTVVLDRFVIEHRAGEGGMATIYRARDRDSGKLVAIKALDDPAHRARFEREVELLASLDHPGIVRYVAHGADAEGRLVMAMEWLEGEDLGTRLAREPLARVDSVAGLRHAAEALGTAHARGIVHRDVKPENLFLVDGDAQRMKVIDFGIARLSYRFGTRTGTILGTPHYMAPEQARGDKVIDARADVFALGCVLFECLAGEAPFQGDDPLAVLARVLYGEAPRLRDRAPDLPAALDDLLGRMLAKDPRQRPTDAAVVARALAKIDLSGLDSIPPPADSRPSLTRGERRLVSVLLLGEQAGAPAPDDRTVVMDAAAAAAFDALGTVSRSFGAELTPLVDGSVLVVLRDEGGAPTDLAARAASCALAMRDAVPKLAVAVATGWTDVPDAVPVGEAIDRACIDLRSARAGDIRLDPVTASLLDERFVRGSGAGAPLLLRRREADTVRTLLGRPTPCVGRDAELAMLESILVQARDEHAARAVVVTAAAGVGKTRLRHELMQRLRARGDPARLWLARGEPAAAGGALGMAAELVRRATDALDGESAERRRVKLVARVSESVPEPERARVATFLGELVGAPDPNGDDLTLCAARADAMVMGDQVRRAWIDFLGAELERGPLILVLEDLHWGDRPTVGLIDTALKLFADRPLCVLAFGRPELDELFPALWAERDALRLPLAGLPRRAAERLVRSSLSAAAEPVVARLCERAAGNAFFLEELIRFEAEGRSEDPPETVLGMLQARLVGLSPEARKVLRAASVFGQSFWVGGAALLLDVARDDGWLVYQLEELVRAELLSRSAGSRFAGETELAFRHALVREAAYAMLVDHDRALGHRLAASWLESVGEVDPTILAGHFEQSGEPHRAVAAYLRAAEQALEGGDLAGVVARAEQGVARGAKGELLGRLRSLQAQAHRWRGEHAELRLRAAEAMAELPRGSAAWCVAAADLAIGHHGAGQHDELWPMTEALCALEPEPGARGAYAVSLARIAVTLSYAGRKEQRDHVVARVNAIEPALGDREPAAHGWILRMRGAIAEDPYTGIVLHQQAAASFERAGDLRGLCYTLGFTGYYLVQLGGYAQAEPALRQMIAVASRLGALLFVSAGKSNLGPALARLGRLDEAERIEREAVRETAGDRRMNGGSRFYLAEILAARGEIAAAEEEARAACETLTVAPPARAHALAILASILLARGAHAEALAAAREAFELREQLGTLEGAEALVHLAFAEALSATGAQHEARRIALLGAERIEALAARIHDEGWRRSFLARVSENARLLERARAWRDP